MKQTLAAVAAVTISLGTFAGCTTAVGPSPSVVPSASRPTPTASATPASAKQLCLAAFKTVRVLSWSPSTVKDFRRFQLGGPKANSPLADAFPGISEDNPGAWCGTKKSEDTIRWWAVVANEQPIRVIDISGPGAGAYRGEVAPPAIRIPAPSSTEH
jgi:hypothetical protein